MARVKTRYPGVYFRATRTAGKPDRYYTIIYRAATGRAREEAVGRGAEGMQPEEAHAIRAVLRQNIRLGRSPQSVAEMRQLEAQRREAEVYRQQAEERDNMPFARVAEEYLEWLAANRKESHSSVSRYTNHIKPALGHLPLKDISPLHLERFKRDLQRRDLAPKSIHHCLAFVRTVYRKARVWGYYPGSNPMAQVAFPAVNNRRLRFLTYTEADRLLVALAARSRQVHDQVLIALHCGLRSGEVRGMRWRDIDLDQGIIHLPETKSGRTQQVHMTKEVVQVLRDMRPVTPLPHALVFPQERGGRKVRISRIFNSTVAALGFNEGLGIGDRRHRVVFHTLRHTFCSWLVIEGVPLYTVKELARHQSITQTERYAHLQKDQKLEAVNLLARRFREERRLDKEPGVVCEP